MAEAKPEVEESLLEVAHPELYRKNAFRITELPVDASARDISRRQATIKQANGMGLPVPPGYGRVLPLKEQPEPDVFSEAIQRLGDPERRLVDEVFWFWPRQFGESRTDPALAALARGENQTVYKFWLSQRENPADEGNALHNLAVLSHVSALDLEVVAYSRVLSEQEQTERAFWWQEAFKYWALVVEDEAFWSCVATRIRDLDDPRLTTGMARRIRTSLLQTLLAANARLAVRAAERGNIVECQQQLTLMHSSGFEQHVTDEALRQATEPVRERIKTLCKMVETQAPADPPKAGDVVERFLDQSQPLLMILDNLLSAGNATRDGMHDEVAQRALISLVIYGNKTENWQAVLLLVERILSIAVGEALRARIEENITSVRGNLVLVRCWYCGKNSPDTNCAHEIKMYGNVTRTPVWQYGRTGTQINWQSRSVQVPRCVSCKVAHSRVSNSQSMGCLTGFGIILAVSIILGATGGFATVLGWTIVLAIIVGIYAPFVMSGRAEKSLRQKGIRNLVAGNEFPVILILKAQGWQIGEKPTQ